MSITENISQEFRLKNIDETTTYFFEEIGQIELMCKKHKKVFWALNDVKHLHFLVSTVTGCVSISGFAYSVGITVVLQVGEFCSRIENLCNNCRN